MKPDRASRNGLPLSVPIQIVEILRMLQNSPVRPYALVGLGMYNTKLHFKATEVSSGTSVEDDFEFDSRFGGKVGLGTMWKASPVIGVGAEVNYNFISEDKDKAGFDSAQYVDVHAGVSFTIPTGATQ